MGRSARRALAVGSLMATALGTGACWGLARVLGVEAPRLETAPERESVLTLDAASLLTGRPRATLRIWTRITNPNDFALTLSTLRGSVFLEDNEMAEVDLPLGLPLLAARDTVIPIDVGFGMPALSSLGALG